MLYDGWWLSNKQHNSVQECELVWLKFRDVNKAGSFKAKSLKAKARSLKARDQGQAKVEFNSYGLKLQSGAKFN